MDYAHIVKTAGTCGGRPRIEGTRITVDMIAEAVVHLKETPEEYQRAHPHIYLSQIHAALAYYYDHQAEIQGIIDDGKKVEQGARQKFPARLEVRIGNCS